MNEDLDLPYRSRALLAAVPATPQWRQRRRLRRRDRLSASLATLHGTVSVLAGAQTAVDLGWTPSRSCANCTSAPTVGCCLVCALTMGGGRGRAGLDTSTQAALDLVWRSMHRGGHRPVHWNAAPVMHALQAHEITRWNDRANVTGADVSALLRAARRQADAAWHAARTAQSEPGPSTPAPGELTH